jgi:hypothetical protein
MLPARISPAAAIVVTACRNATLAAWRARRTAPCPQ